MSLWTRPLLVEVSQAFRLRAWPRGFKVPADWPRGQTWKVLTGDDWQRHPGLLSTFEPDAFCYFLPSVMVISDSMTSGRLDAAEHLIELLADSAENPQPVVVERLQLLSPEERSTVSVWLARISRYDIYPPDKILACFQTMVWSTCLSSLPLIDGS